ncbi:zinc finger C2HC domain-containing protein 1B-like isoform X2 [Ptychodera flava]|uniref:zinc finger C2HC domain-containing protein 1B-like isoform X2 n=1 Tax=Ptychodera flava TaxID=63121 RepID=UPI00396A89C4
MADIDDEVPEYVNPVEFDACGVCGRTFRPDVLVKHERICEKNHSKKRKVFNSTKQRVSGTEITSVRKQPEPKQQSKNNWRAKHEEFLASLKAARGVSHAMKTGAPLPPPPKATINPDYIQCPTCERRFNAGAAERHIPWCAEKAKRIPPNSKAEQLKQRTQYKPPLPGAKRAGSGKKTTSVGQKNSPTNRTTGMTNGRAGSGGSLSNGYSSSMYSTRKPSSENSRTRAPASHQYRYEDETDSDGLSPHSVGRIGSGDSYRSVGSRTGSGSRAIKSKPPSGTSNRETVVKRTPTPPSYSRPSSLNRQPSMENVNGKRASKFCYECGTKYPVPHAKYCCECGIKRVWID